MCSISTNILIVLANSLGIQNSIFSKNIGRDRGNTNVYVLPYMVSLPIGEECKNYLHQF